MTSNTDIRKAAGVILLQQRAVKLLARHQSGPTKKSACLLTGIGFFLEHTPQFFFGQANANTRAVLLCDDLHERGPRWAARRLDMGRHSLQATRRRVPTAGITTTRRRLPRPNERMLLLRREDLLTLRRSTQEPDKPDGIWMLARVRLQERRRIPQRLRVGNPC